MAVYGPVTFFELKKALSMQTKDAAATLKCTQLWPLSRTNVSCILRASELAKH